MDPMKRLRPKAKRSITPGRKFSITASATATTARTVSRPSSVLRSTISECFPHDNMSNAGSLQRAPGRVDADHFRPQIGQHHADQRPGEVLTEIQNTEMRERTGGHGVTSFSHAEASSGGGPNGPDEAHTAGVCELLRMIAARRRCSPVPGRLIADGDRRGTRRRSYAPQWGTRCVALWPFELCRESGVSLAILKHLLLVGSGTVVPTERISKIAAVSSSITTSSGNCWCSGGTTGETPAGPAVDPYGLGCTDGGGVVVRIRQVSAGVGTTEELARVAVAGP